MSWTKKKKRTKAAFDPYEEPKTSYEIATETKIDPVAIDPIKKVEEAEEQLEMRQQILDLFSKEQLERMVLELKQGILPAELRGFQLEDASIEDLYDVFQGVLSNL